MPKLLFVTNNVKILASWEEALLLGGHKVDVAITGEEALKRALTGNPELILIDEDDPSKDLILRHLKKNEKTGSIPSLAVKSADITRGDVVLKRIGEVLKKKKVLIAEDDRQMASILKVILESRKYEARTSFDGVETLKEVKSWQPDLLVLDIMLPVIDGFHICQQINNDQTFEKKPKVLIISGRESEWDKNLGRACGAEFYLVKPFDNQFFIEKVGEILS